MAHKVWRMTVPLWQAQQPITNRDSPPRSMRTALGVRKMSVEAGGLAQMDRLPLLGDTAGNIIPRKRYWALAIHNSFALVSHPRYTKRRNGTASYFKYTTQPHLFIRLTHDSYRFSFSCICLLIICTFLVCALISAATASRLSFMAPSISLLASLTVFMNSLKAD